MLSVNIRQIFRSIVHVVDVQRHWFKDEPVKHLTVQRPISNGHFFNLYSERYTLEILCYQLFHLSDLFKSLHFLFKKPMVHGIENYLEVQITDFYSLAPSYSTCYFVQESNGVRHA